MIRFFLLVLLCIAPALAVAGDARLVMDGNEIVVDTNNKLMWQFDKSQKAFATHDQAAAYAASLRLGGYDDWRLPSLAERWDLLQIFVFKNNNGLEFSKFDNKYWTTESDKGAQPIKLDLSCMCRGDMEVEYKIKGYVRAVRSMAAATR